MTPDEYNAAVLSIMRVTGCDRTRADEVAQSNGYRVTVDPVTAQRDAAIREKEEQGAIVKIFRGFGFKVSNLSQSRPTKQEPGLPDLWVTHRARGLAFWWESKRQVDGTYSSEQLDFRADCAAAGVECRGGDRHAAAEYLIELGIMERAGDVLEPTQPPHSTRRNGAHAV